MRLQNKFLAFLLPAGAVSAGLILLLVRRSVHSAIMNELEKSLLTVTNAAAQDAAPSFESGSESFLLPRLQALQNREGALYAAALDPRGRILADTSILKKGSVRADAITRSVLRSRRSSADFLLSSGEPVLEIDVPVWSAPSASPEDAFLFSGRPRAGPRTFLGLLRLGVSLEPALEVESRILRGIVLIIAVIGALAAGFVLALVRGILKPVNSLMAGISKLAKGRYDEEVPVVSSDEIGDLALNFNRMSGELARTTVSKDYVEGILKNMLDPLVVTDPAGRIKTMNPAMLDILSYSAAELTGRPISSLFRAAPPYFQGRDFPVLLPAGGVRDIEATLLAKSGREIPVLFSASFLHDGEGRLRGYIGVAKDMTERTRAEAALVAAKAAAEASSKELEAFSYSVAHDLRAPLRAVDGFSQIVLSRYADKLDEEGKDFLVRVRGGSRRMGQLIDDLLNLSRIARAAMRVEPVDLSGLAAEIAAELQKSQPEREAEFVIEKNLAAPGDPNLLRVVLVNLLGNSWKYTSKRPAARIEFGAERSEGTQAFFVRDDGAGYDMAFSKLLFKPFNRLHAAAEFEGTGIGLATVQRVIERHDGRVWGEGEVGKGATFRFTLWEGTNHGHEDDPARGR
ncbi:MAG TPA: ATP-binding protein [Elusimicrobiota bacterium]|jgi:PAS domain S-box-containing protein|nr:ATP-binding protein [Elusimicrobiota bacterium]